MRSSAWIRRHCFGESKRLTSVRTNATAKTGSKARTYVWQRPCGRNGPKLSLATTSHPVSQTLYSTASPSRFSNQLRQQTASDTEVVFYDVETDVLVLVHFYNNVVALEDAVKCWWPIAFNKVRKDALDVAR